jgi:hypothetical protein
MPAFDLRPVAESLLEIGRLNAAVYEALGAMVRIDDRGGVELDEREARATLERLAPPELVDSSLEDLSAMAQAGVALFEESAVPWLALEDFAFSFQGLPEAMRSELGVEGARDADAARERLLEAFPNVPDTVFVGRGAELLLRDWIAKPGVEPPDGGGGFDPQEDRPSRPRPARPTRPPLGGVSVSGAVPISPPQADEVANCLLNGSWDGLVRGVSVLGANPTWVLGWSVCVSQDCAEKLAALLLALDGGTFLLSAIARGKGVVAAVVSLPASAAIAFYAALLAVTIRLANGPNGVCIYGNWPTIGGPGAHVWALPG